MTKSLKIRLLTLAVAPLAMLMVYGCGGGGGGGSGSGSSGGGSSSSSSASQSSYVAGTNVTVSTRNNGIRLETTVAGLKNGNYVVAWSDLSVLTGAPDTSDAAILYRIMSPSGAAVTAELTANTTTAGKQSRPTVLALDGGGFVMAWEDYSASPSSGFASGVIRAQLFDANGTKSGAELRVSTATLGDWTAPEVVPAGSGFMITYREFIRDIWAVTQADNVRSQIYTATGAKVGSELLLKAFATGSIGGRMPSTSVVGLSDGTFALAYEDLTSSSSGNGPLSKVQLFTSQGVASGQPLTLNRAGPDSLVPALVRLDGGRFAAIWQTSGATNYTLRSQAYTNAGASYGAQFTITPPNYRAAAGLTGGNYAVLYSDGNKVSGQILTPEGTKYLTEFDVATGNAVDAVDMDVTTAGFAVAWSAPNSTGNSHNSIILRIYTRQ